MAGRVLHLDDVRPVLQGGGDERRPHGVGGVAAGEADGRVVRKHAAVDGVRVHMPAAVLGVAVVVKRPKERPCEIFAVAGDGEISSDSLNALRVDRESDLAVPLPYDS